MVKSKKEETVVTPDTFQNGGSNAAILEESVTQKTDVIPVKSKTIPTDTMIPCVSMVKTGALTYASKRQNGYKINWDHFGDVQYLDITELMSMRSGDQMFFSENWIAISEDCDCRDEVMKLLRINEFYKNTPDPNAMEKLFAVPIEVMISKISKMSVSLRESVKTYVVDSIADGSLDSRKRIAALEKILGCTFD